jgi:hypothetical protein
MGPHFSGESMKHRFVMGAVAMAALAFSACDAGDALKSGLPVGGRTTPFHPLNVTGDSKDKKNCLV